MELLYFLKMKHTMMPSVSVVFFHLYFQLGADVCVDDWDFNTEILKMVLKDTQLLTSV